MVFECSLNFNETIETWTERIVNYKATEGILEMYVESRSSLHIIIGRGSYGNFVCIPNYDVRCYLSRFNDTF